jgi:hypothetical protein
LRVVIIASLEKDGHDYSNAVLRVLLTSVTNSYIRCHALPAAGAA